MKPIYNKLIKEAQKIRKKAYCPYSGYSVGAAVLTGSGKMYMGCNVENSSYGLTVCAERVAIFNAAMHGERSIKAVAISLRGEDPISPCGACRQVIAEFGDDIDVIMSCTSKKIKFSKIQDLFPMAFKKISDLDGRAHLLPRW